MSSEYQRLKARALEIHKEKEYELQRELRRKAERDKQAAKEEEERQKRQEAARKEARRLELMRLNPLQKKAEPQAAPTVGEYDPFAEDAVAKPSKPQPRSTPKTAKAADPGGRTTNTGANTGAKRAPAKKVEPAALGRKEKAALKLFRSTKGTRASAEDSLFSVRALVDGHDGRTGSLGPGSGASSPRRLPQRTSSAPPRSAPTSKTPTKSMSQMKKSVDVSTLTKLCKDRSTRDTRTLDEIQRDIRARKGISGPSTPARNDRQKRPGSERRHRSSSESDFESDSPPRKRSRASPPRRGEPSSSAISALIQGMFSRGRAPRHYDDDSGSDMEAGLSDVEAEEKRALRLARKEDEEAERLENERKAAKERMKRERERKGK